MKIRLTSFVAAGLALLVLRAPAAELYVDLNCPTPAPPYSDWSTAATNIQDAIDASSNGDQIWVTNGIYQTGGKVMAGDLTNRVALDKAVTVQSVNGPWSTVIQGAGATNGSRAVRCAWLTNNATLIGFTLKWGATRTGGDTFEMQSGGGVWCASANAIAANCVIASNTAFVFGGGAYQGTLNNCLVSSNSALAGPGGLGGGLGGGGGACNAILNNCTVVSNFNVGVYATASNLARATNCIIYFNIARNGVSPNYSSGGTFAYCCTIPAAAGTGNFTNAPQLFADVIHLTSASPCIGAGVNAATGTDIFGKAWANPPSLGCAEFDPIPMVTKPKINLTGDPVGFVAGNVIVGGQSQFACWWLKDGTPLQDDGHFSSTQTTNLVATGIVFSDAGGYQLVVSNSFGVVTSGVAQLVIHCVDVAGTTPVAPYTNWMTAATNIQDAITASVAGDIVLVTNGLYATGGKSMDGVITNRVSVDKAILVQGVSGANVTIIQGAWDPVSTNGPGAVRCAWLTNYATLSGFTLRGGATRALYSGTSAMSGGGVWSSSNSATLFNCIIATNSASDSGGGAYRSKLISCFIIGNSAKGTGTGTGGSGGGADLCNLTGCLLMGNSAGGDGGGASGCGSKNCAFVKNRAILSGSGASYGALVNCTITGNLAGGYASQSGAVANAILTNCIVYGNTTMPGGFYTNYYSSTFSYCDTDPLPAGAGNVDVDPQLGPDGYHLMATSPCIGAGIASVISGIDIDGQAWTNPPAIGCDEWKPAPVFGAQPLYKIGFPAHGLTFGVIVAGQSPFSYFWSKDATLIQDDTHHSNSGTDHLIVNNFGPDDTGIYQVVVSNASGVVTSQMAQVVIHAVDAAGANPTQPYSTWATAATTIQDAIDIAADGDIVLVTNGLYATGGKVMAGDLTNRVVLNKAVTVSSVNGPWTTVIQGTWDPVSTNGNGFGATRCAWLTDGAVLNGFTLQNGGTRATGDPAPGGPLESGGGLWCASTNALVSDCILTNNGAVYGGGIARGTLNNSCVIYNHASFGGGAYYATLNNCTVLYNGAVTPSWDISADYGAGTYDCLVHNSIVLDNYDFWPILLYRDNFYYDSSFSSPTRYVYSCTDPSIYGAGNINGYTSDPQLLDSFHIAATSPCRGTASPLYDDGTDLDGEPWANPPSMGCDEVIVSNLVGPLSVSLSSYGETNVLLNRYAGFWGTITGHASYVTWSFGDGPIFNDFGAGGYHRWTNAGVYTVTCTAYNNDNTNGVATSVSYEVLPLNIPLLKQAVWTTNGFQFEFDGQWSITYIVQCTTNLTPPVSWQTLQTIYYNMADVTQITDTTSSNTARFYRVLAQ